jgi:circadian clock protein KaiC
MFVIKSRGIAHSNQVREFVLSDQGPRLVEVYVGPEGVLTGSARRAQMQRESSARGAHRIEGERRRLALAQRATAIEAQIADLQAQLAAENEAYRAFVAAQDSGQSLGAADRAELSRRLSERGDSDENSDGDVDGTEQVEVRHGR